MSGLKCFTYMAWNNYQYSLNTSHDPLLDLKYLHREKDYQQLALLTPALPVGISQYVLHAITDESEINGDAEVQKATNTRYGHWLTRVTYRLLGKRYERISPWKILSHKFAQASSLLNSLGLESLPKPELLGVADCLQTSLPKAREIELVEQALQGKILYLEEIERFLAGRKVSLTSFIENILQMVALRGSGQKLAAVTFQPDGKPVCMRCGQATRIKLSYCLDCGSQRCYYCEDCLSSGESRLCKPLYALPWRREPRQLQVEFRPDVSLGPAQAHVAWALRNFIVQGKAERAIVQAASSAGRIEVVFWAVCQVLQNGGRVLLSFPRQDMVKEAEARVRAFFPRLPLNILVGDCHYESRRAPLVLATPGNVIRLYRDFNLVVLDECDTNPYRGRDIFRFACTRACTNEGKIIALTDIAWGQDWIQLPRSELISLPAREHGFPLPVPEFVLEKSLLENQEGAAVPEKILELLHRCVEGDLAQVFIFVPSAYLAQKVGQVLARTAELPPFNNFAGDWVRVTHTKDPERFEKEQLFSQGQFPILVIAGLPARNIPVLRVNVMVLFCENEQVMDRAMLIRMAGKAGLSPEYPNGRVWFVGTSVTGAMKAARETIEAINQEAAREGYLYAGQPAKTFINSVS